MTPVAEFTIKRSIWLRGEGSYSMLLRRNDHKQCCLGIYLEACGVPRDDLSDILAPSGVFGCAVPGWLLEPFSDDDSDAAVRLMEVNDDRSIADAEREAAVAARFRDVGITVRFKD